MEHLVAVSTVQGQFAEEQVRAFLEANGIPTEVRGEHCGRRTGFPSMESDAFRFSFRASMRMRRARCSHRRSAVISRSLPDPRVQ